MNMQIVGIKCKWEKAMYDPGTVLVSVSFYALTKVNCCFPLPLKISIILNLNGGGQTASIKYIELKPTYGARKRRAKERRTVRG